MFQSYRDGNFHLWSIGADGTDLKQLTIGPHDCREPRFSPDGRRIAYSSDRSGRYAIHVLDRASGRGEPLPEPPGSGPLRDRKPSRRGHPTAALIALVTDKSRLEVVDLQGRRTTVASLAPAVDTFHPAEIHSPSWTIDGHALIYTTFESGKARLIRAQHPTRTRAVAGGRRRRVPISGGLAAWRGLHLHLERQDPPPLAGLGRGSTIEFSATVPVVTPTNRRKRSATSTRLLTRQVKGIGSPVSLP